MTDTVKSLRLWPAVVIVTLQWIVVLGAPALAPETMIHFLGVFFAPMVGLVLLGIWWLFFSRAPMGARWGGAGLFVVATAVLLSSAHESMQAALAVYAMPRICLALLFVAALINVLPNSWRTPVALVGAGLVLLPWTLLRTDPLDGEMRPSFSWRWSPTTDERLAAIGSFASGAGTAPLTASPDDWTGLRGPRRDARIDGLTLETDWSATPPVELWRRPLGPAWSSFAIVGDALFTQEQRGDQEFVTAYRKSDGEPLWSDGIESRFFDPISGAGPRGTPTFADGRVFTVSGMGIVRAHDATTGQLLWSHDLMAEVGAPLLDWGFAGSPLVLDDRVVVYAGNPEGPGLIAYGAADGDVRWTAPASTNSYSSPHLLTLAGVPQIVMLHSDGVTSHAPEDGALLWKHDWPIPGRGRIVQPLLLDGDRLLVGTSFGEGTRLLQIHNSGATWSAEEIWTSRDMKPYYNDFAAHDGHLYGFDTKILASIDLTDGKRNWKRGRYGHGQLMLFADQGLLLVLAEDGDLALVEARPDAFVELAKIQALEGITWNHMALDGDVLYIRNDREMAAYRLPVRGGAVTPDRASSDG